jgi:hypothetical protein
VPADVLARHPQVMVMTDDIYEHIRSDGRRTAHLLKAAPELRDRTLVVDGVSKTYAMTGWLSLHRLRRPDRQAHARGQGAGRGWRRRDVLARKRGRRRRGGHRLRAVALLPAVDRDVRRNAGRRMRANRPGGRRASQSLGRRPV